MSQRMRALAWADTPVGPPHQWPQSLRAAVSILLECQLPMYIAWGPALTQLFNDAYVPILGAKHPRALGRPAPETWGEIWGTIGPMWQKVLAGEPIGFDDFKLTIERFGYPEDCYFNFSYSPLRDDDGRVAGVLVTFAETTRQVLGEQRFRFLDALAEATRALSDPVQVMQATAGMLGRYLGVNRCAYAQVHEDEDTFDLVGDYNDGVPSIVGRYRFSAFGAAAHRLMREGRAYVNADVDADPVTAGTDLAAYRLTAIQAVVCVPLHKNGRLVAAMAVHQKTPRRWTDDEVTVVQTVVNRCWEALQRMALLESERAARVEAERASALKDEFLATLSHELRTPLNAILGWAHILRRKIDGTHPDITRGVDVIERSTRVQVQLIEELLDMSRITSGKLRMDTQPVAPATFVQAAVDVIRPSAEAAGVALMATIEPVDTVLGDAARLQQVTWNLLANAVKFTPRGGEVRLDLRAEGDHMVLTVQDTGAGIRPEFLSHVFERFRQADGSITRKFGGLGLGLSIVRHIVEQHGGTIRAHSDGEGRGSRFEVRVPLREAARDDGAGIPREGAREAGDFDLAGVRVLVVDDERDARELLQRVLEESGAEVVVAGDAAAALAALPHYGPHVLVSDIGMPGTDGYELLSRVRVLPPEQGGTVPAIALTAFARAEDRERALRAGFDAHLAKATDPLEVVGVVGRAARRGRGSTARVPGG
jgi:signal transduction histidine kinase/ActR/RegA family two-component response regulator